MQKMNITPRKPRVKLKSGLLLVLGGLVMALCSQPARTCAASDKAVLEAAPAGEGSYHKNRILIKLRPEIAEQVRQGKKTKLPNKLQRWGNNQSTWYSVEAGGGESAKSLMDNYRKKYADLLLDSQLDYACEIYKDNAKHPQEDVLADEVAQQYLPFFSQDPLMAAKLQWHLRAIDITTAWTKTTGNPGVVIAIADTGVAYENNVIPQYEAPKVSSLSTFYKRSPGLGNMKLWVNSREQRDNGIDDDGDGYVDDVNGFDFMNRDSHPDDDNGHGTFLANLLAYSAPGEPSGIAPFCSYMLLKVLDYNGRGYASTVAEGIYYAADHGAKVINLSLAWPPGLNPGPIVEDAVDYAAIAGVIIVAGTGNNADDRVCYPAAYDQVIAVGATQLDNTRAGYSNYGTKLELMAPGGNNGVDLNLDGYPDGIIHETLNPPYRISLLGEELLANPSAFGKGLMQGTSLATAIATGVVGLLVSLNPRLDLSCVRNTLYHTATDLDSKGWDRQYGYGLVNAGKAVTQIALCGCQCSYEILPVPEDSDTDSDDDSSLVPTPLPDPVVQDPACLDDLEIETECDECLIDEEVEEECLN